MTDNAPRPRRFLRRKQQADRWGRSVRTVVRWGDDPKMGLPAEYSFGREPLRDEAEIEAWEQSRKVEKPTKPKKPAPSELSARGRKLLGASEARGRGA